MALSEKERNNILYYLGWANQTLTEGKVHYNSVVDDRLTDLTSYAERVIKGILTRLENLDSCLDAAKCRLAATQVDGVTTNPKELVMLRNERKKWVRELSDYLDVPIVKSNDSIGVVV